MSGGLASLSSVSRQLVTHRWLRLNINSAGVLRVKKKNPSHRVHLGRETWRRLVLCGLQDRCCTGILSVCSQRPGRWQVVLLGVASANFSTNAEWIGFQFRVLAPCGYRLTTFKSIVCLCLFLSLVKNHQKKHVKQLLGPYFKVVFWRQHSASLVDLTSFLLQVCLNAIVCQSVGVLSSSFVVG